MELGRARSGDYPGRTRHRARGGIERSGGVAPGPRRHDASPRRIPRPPTSHRAPGGPTGRGRTEDRRSRTRRAARASPPPGVVTTGIAAHGLEQAQERSLGGHRRLRAGHHRRRAGPIRSARRRACRRAVAVDRPWPDSVPSTKRAVMGWPASTATPADEAPVGAFEAVASVVIGKGRRPRARRGPPAGHPRAYADAGHRSVGRTGGPPISWRSSGLARCPVGRGAPEDPQDGPPGRGHHADDGHGAGTSPRSPAMAPPAGIASRTTAGMDAHGSSVHERAPRCCPGRC